MRRRTSAVATATALLSWSVTLVLVAEPATAVTTVVQTFNFASGVQTSTAPANATMAQIDAYGAQGGAGSNAPASPGGLGGRTTGIILVAPGDTFDVRVGRAGRAASIGGAGGTNGGGQGGISESSAMFAGGGGGASDVRPAGGDLASRIVVAGGGGGGGGPETQGGAGGAVGGPGEQETAPVNNGGGGGTAASGGAGGAIGFDPDGGGAAGSPGVLGVGGTGGTYCCIHTHGGGGGGGGGYYGGGGGGTGQESGGGGGGGSGFGPAGTVYETGVRSGDGLVVITYTIADPTTTTMTGAPAISGVYGEPLTVGAQVCAPSGPAPTGTMQFKANGSPLGSPVALGAPSGSCAAASTSTGALLVGSHVITATYLGSTAHQPSTTSSPVVLTVTKANTTTTFTESPSPSTAGQTVTFRATVCPTAPSSAGAPPTGQVRLLVDGSAVGTPAGLAAGPGNCGTAVADWPLEFGSTTIQMIYDGDSRHNFSPSVVRAPVVLKATPTLSTEAASTTIGGSVTDRAIVAGGFAPSGTVTFRAYSDASCTTQVFTSTNTLDNGEATSDPFTPTQAGNYRWRARYNGDTNNSAVLAPCGAANETSTVAKATPTLATQATTSVNLGQPIQDVATVSGGYSPTGTVSFAVYGPNDANCSGTPAFTSLDRPLNPGGQATSAAFTPTQVGRYRWRARYNGDVNNVVVAAPCNAANERSDVLGADLVIRKTGPAVVTAGVPFSYTIGVRNNGPMTASNVEVTDSLPAGVTLVSAPGCLGTTVLTCNLGSLADGAVASVTITVRPDRTNPFGTVLTNRVSVASSTPDHLPNNNDDSVTSSQTGCTGTKGTSGDDVICAGPRAALVQGGAGDDVIYGSPFNDLLQGGAGDDVIFGGDGKDLIQGGAGTDHGDGGTGRDMCQQFETQANCP